MKADALLMMEIPEDVRAAAIKVSNYFKTQNCQKWQLFDIESRDYTKPKKTKLYFEDLMRGDELVTISIRNLTKSSTTTYFMTQAKFFNGGSLGFHLLQMDQLMDHFRSLP